MLQLTKLKTLKTRQLMLLKQQLIKLKMLKTRLGKHCKTLAKNSKTNSIWQNKREAFVPLFFCVN